MITTTAQYAQFIARNIEGAKAAAEYARLARSGRDGEARAAIEAAMSANTDANDGYFVGFLDYLERLIGRATVAEIDETLASFTAEMMECLELDAEDAE